MGWYYCCRWCDYGLYVYVVYAYFTTTAETILITRLHTCTNL